MADLSVPFRDYFESYSTHNNIEHNGIWAVHRDRESNPELTADSRENFSILAWSLKACLMNAVVYMQAFVILYIDYHIC